MFAKIIVLVAAVAAVAFAEPCGFCSGYLSNGVAGYGLESRVLNAGCTVPVASAYPACAPIATPTCIENTVAAPVVANAVVPAVTGPVGAVSTGLYGSGLYGSGLYGSGLYGSGFYGGYGCGASVY